MTSATIGSRERRVKNFMVFGKNTRAAARRHSENCPVFAAPLRRCVGMLFLLTIGHASAAVGSEPEIYIRLNQLGFEPHDHKGFRLPQNETVDYGWRVGSYRVVYFADGKPQGLRQYQSESNGVANLACRYAGALRCSLAFRPTGFIRRTSISSRMRC